MSPLDALLLAAILTVCLWRILLPERGAAILRLTPWALVFLALLQLAFEGPYLQFAPAYLLVPVTFALTRRPRRPLMRALGAAAVALAATAPFAILLPVPTLPAPQGPYSVGTRIYRWVDDSRAEEATADPADRRNVVVQAWYPAAPGAKGGRLPYIDGAKRLPSRVSGVPSFLIHNYGRIDTHAVADAPLSSDRATWPVVVFLPGYGGARAFYSSLTADLASRGYVVLAVDHPYEAAVAELADGRIATTVENFSPDDPDRTGFMEGRLKVRLGDVRFVLDQMARPGALEPDLGGRLDATRVFAAGHSFGGAAAGAAMAGDERLKAAVNIDGTLYGPISAGRPQPFMLLESDHGETPHGALYEDGARRLFDRFGGGYRYELARANHYSFTDALLFLGPPARWASSWVVGGGRGPAETHRATVDLIVAFLQGSLNGTPVAVEAAASRYGGIAGRTVSTPPR